MAYEYIDGKQRVMNILNSSVEIIEKKSVPQNENEWTYANGIETWISSIFVDLRESTDFLTNGDRVEVTKTLRSYASEIIEILNGTTLVREIGVRGDGIYGIFSTPSQQSIFEILKLTYWINTYMKMLNELLSNKGLNKIKAGIGMATSRDLIAKVGRKGTGINDKVWIGECIAEADRLSKITSKGVSYNVTTKPIAISETVYTNAKEIKENVTDFFSYDSSRKCYFGEVVIIGFNDWIKGGMKE